MWPDVVFIPVDPSNMEYKMCNYQLLLPAALFRPRVLQWSRCVFYFILLSSLSRLLLFPVSTDVPEQRSARLRSVLRGEVAEDVCQSHADAAAVVVGAAGISPACPSRRLISVKGR